MTQLAVESAFSPQPSALSPEERAVLAVLARHRGRGRAIHKEALAEAVGLNLRYVRSVIVVLIEQRGFAIGSASHPPAGYFLIENGDERDVAINECRSRIIRLAARMAALKQNTAAACLGQLSLELNQCIIAD